MFIWPRISVQDNSNKRILLHSFCDKYNLWPIFESLWYSLDDLLSCSADELKEVFWEFYFLFLNWLKDLRKNWKIDSNISWSEILRTVYYLFIDAKFELWQIDKFKSQPNSQRVVSFLEETKTRVFNLVWNFWELEKRLLDYYQRESHTFRDRQKQAYLMFILDLVNNWKWWLIKLPTWAWKTILFWHIIKALWIWSLILVPRTNLVSWTKRKLEEKLWFSWITSIDSDNKDIKWIVKQVKWLFNSRGSSITWQNVIITYQSLLLLKDENKELYDFLMTSWLIVCDEAHRSLWAKTSEAILKEDNSLTLEELEAEEQIMQELSKRWSIYLHFTATPSLLTKEIEEDLIYSSTIWELVEDWDLVFPTQRNHPKAIIRPKVQEDSWDELELNAYMFEKWVSVYEALTCDYLEEKWKNGWYLPTVAFCNTTKQAEEYVRYCEKNWIKAIQCVSKKWWTNYKEVSEAEKLLESWEADIVVTCSKVWEWWDLPTLRWSMWLTPSWSPARVSQGNWRILRTLSEEEIERISTIYNIPREYVEKTTKNTFIFSPSSWEYYYEYDNIWEWNWEQKEKSNWWKWLWDWYKNWVVYTWLEAWLHQWEIDEEFAREYWLEIDFNWYPRLDFSKYLAFFESTSWQKDLNRWWIVINTETKEINLSKILSPTNKEFTILWQKANSFLLKLAKNIWFEEEFWFQLFNSKSQAIRVLKYFFEKAWYDVVESKEDFWRYFTRPRWIEELLNWWIVVNITQKTIDLRTIKNITDSDFVVYWHIAQAFFKKLYKSLSSELKSQIKTYDWTKKISSVVQIREILRVLFESMWYKAITWEWISYWLEFFESEKWVEKLNKWWIEIDLAWKKVDFRNIKIPSWFSIDWCGAQFAIVKIYKLLSREDQEKVTSFDWMKRAITNKTQATQILKVFFESFWYEVIL